MAASSPKSPMLQSVRMAAFGQCLIVEGLAVEIEEL